MRHACVRAFFPWRRQFFPTPPLPKTGPGRRKFGPSADIPPPRYLDRGSLSLVFSEKMLSTFKMAHSRFTRTHTHTHWNTYIFCPARMLPPPERWGGTWRVVQPKGDATRCDVSSRRVMYKRNEILCGSIALFPTIVFHHVCTIRRSSMSDGVESFRLPRVPLSSNGGMKSTGHCVN